MIIGTAGHIDHGKTALVKALTGVDTDRLPEEKRRGITVELGFAPIDLPGFGAASIIDVPGHEAFVKTMVAGAAGIDVALLVIAGDEGVMPQTREHLSILEILAIPQMVVALTKSDLVDEEWIGLVRADVQEILRASPWPDAPVLSCSAVSRQGLQELRGALAAAAALSSARQTSDLFRLPVDRSFSLKGTGTVITGSVWTGELSQGEEVTLLPSGKTTRVRQLHRHGTEVPRVHSGDRAAVALTGVDVSEAPRGSVLVTDQSWEPTPSLDAWVTLAQGAEASLRPRAKLRFHLGGSDVGATIVTAGSVVEVSGGFFARIKLDATVAARGGDRFVLRLPAPRGTVGGGVVLDPFPARRSVTAAAKNFPIEAIHDSGARLRAMLSAADDAGLAVASIAVRAGCTPEEVHARLSGCEAVVYGPLAFTREALESAKIETLRALETAETTFPLSPGVQRESVRASVKCRSELFDLLVTELAAAGSVVVDGPLLKRSGWNVSLSSNESGMVDALVRAIRSAGAEPPSTGELEKKFGNGVPDLLRYLEREGRVVQVGADRFYARGTVDALIEKLRAGLTPGREYAPSQLRDLLGFSRKYLIPFLEYCDRTGVTLRKGDARTLRSVQSS